MLVAAATEQENNPFHNSSVKESYGLSDSGAKDEPLKYSSDLFCDTSRSESANESMKSGLFGELDQLYKQQKEWNKEQAQREKVLRQMQLQY